MTELSLNAITVLRERYLWPKGKRQSSKLGELVLETPDQLFKRVARAISGPNKALERRFYRALSNLEFLPNSPTLMNAGKKNGQLAACFVLPLKDDLREIMDTLKWTALIHQSGGGTGFSFSELREHGASVASSHGVASGPIGFLQLFNELTQTIKQGGLRRGANMGVLDVSHPDIEDFIVCKTNTSKITNFNISVSAGDRFFNAVLKGEPWELVDPHTRKAVRKVDSVSLFEKICQAAWNTGEPGLIFIDEVNRNNPTPNVGRIVATNPCGEQPLLPYEACNLGSINLNAVYDSASCDGINWDKLSELVETGVLFLNRVIDVCHYPIPEITELCRAHRKIGLGVMGFADLLLRLKVAYGSPESYKIADQVMGFIREQAILVSQALAKKQGPFDGYSKSLWKKRGVKPLRNATLTTVAPTGTLSLIANASPGIEPVFSFLYERHVLDGHVLTEKHPLYKENLSPEEKKYFVTTRDLSPEQHVTMQAHFQKHSDSAVSKTINFATSATVDDVRNAYLLAHKLKCKGITIYRDGSRPNQVMQEPPAFCPDCARS